MYLYNKLTNVVHDTRTLCAECKIDEKDKNYCVLVDDLDNVDQQGLTTFSQTPKRCPFCINNSD